MMSYIDLYPKAFGVITKRVAENRQSRSRSRMWYVVIKHIMCHMNVQQDRRQFGHKVFMSPNVGPSCLIDRRTHQV